MNSSQRVVSRLTASASVRDLIRKEASKLLPSLASFSSGLGRGRASRASSANRPTWMATKQKYRFFSEGPKRQSHLEETKEEEVKQMQEDKQQLKMPEHHQDIREVASDRSHGHIQTTKDEQSDINKKSNIPTECEKTPEPLDIKEEILQERKYQQQNQKNQMQKAVLRQQKQNQDESSKEPPLKEQKGSPHRLTIQIFSQKSEKHFAGLLVVIGFYWIAQDYYKKYKKIKAFLDHHHKYARKCANDAGLIIHEDGSNAQHILDFLNNSTWKLADKFSKEENKVPITLEDQKKQKSNPQYQSKNFIYYHGDPGIGKSSAFASLVVNLNKSKATRDIIEKTFPYFKKYRKFIFIDSEYNFKETTKQDWDIYFRQLKKDKYLIIVDDAHRLATFEKGRDILKQLGLEFERVVLLASQAPVNKFFRNISAKNKICLVELPQFEAIRQLQNCIRNEMSYIPPKLSDYFAYRLWFYNGGNLRAIKSVIGTDIQMKKVCLEKAGNQSMNEKYNDPQSQKPVELFKYNYFDRTLNFLLSNPGLSLASVTQLGFCSARQQFKVDLQGAVDDFLDRNILVGKNEVIGFHSRRTQYAFSRWFSQYQKNYWKDKPKQAHWHYQQLVERIEYEYILNFKGYLLEKELERRRVAKRAFRQSDSKKKKEEQKSANSLENGSDSELESLIKLIEARTKLGILYYQAYQESSEIQIMTKAKFEPKPILKELQKGAREFYQKNKEKVEKGLDGNQELRTRIEDQKKIIAALEANPSVTEKIQKLWERTANEFIIAFESIGGFSKQSKNMVKLDEITKEEMTELQVTEEKIEKAMENLKEELHQNWRELLIIGLEQIADALYQVKKGKEGAQKGEALEKAN